MSLQQTLFNFKAKRPPSPKDSKSSIKSKDQSKIDRQSRKDSMKLPRQKGRDKESKDSQESQESDPEPEAQTLLPKDLLQSFSQRKVQEVTREDFQLFGYANRTCISSFQRSLKQADSCGGTKVAQNKSQSNEDKQTFSSNIFNIQVKNVTKDDAENKIKDDQQGDSTPVQKRLTSHICYEPNNSSLTKQVKAFQKNKGWQGDFYIKGDLLQKITQAKQATGFSMALYQEAGLCFVGDYEYNISVYQIQKLKQSKTQCFQKIGNQGQNYNLNLQEDAEVGQKNQQILQGECLRELKGHLGWVKQLQVATNRKQLISGDERGGLIIWELDPDRRNKQRYASNPQRDKSPSSRTMPGKSCKKTQTMGPKMFFQSLQFNWLEQNQADGISMMGKLQGHKSEITGLCLSKDEMQLYSCSLDETIRIWNLDTRKQEIKINAYQRQLNHICLSAERGLFRPFPRTLFCCSNDGKIKAFKADTLKELFVLEQPFQQVLVIAITDDSKTLISGNNKGEVKFWCLNSNEMIHTIKSDLNEEDAISCLKVFKGQLIIGHYSGLIKMIKLKDYEEIKREYTQTDNLLALEMSKDNCALYSKTFKYFSKWGHFAEPNILQEDLQQNPLENKDIIELQEKLKREEEEKKHTHDKAACHHHHEEDDQLEDIGEVICGVLSNDQETFYYGDKGNQIKAHDRKTKKIKACFKGHQGQINYMEVSADDTRLFSGSSDCRIKIWHTETFKCLQTLSMDDSVESVRLSPCEQYLGAHCIQESFMIFQHNAQTDKWDVVIDEFNDVNGFNYSIDGKYLYICEWYSNRLVKYDFQSLLEEYKSFKNTRDYPKQNQVTKKSTFQTSLAVKPQLQKSVSIKEKVKGKVLAHECYIKVLESKVSKLIYALGNEYNFVDIRKSNEIKLIKRVQFRDDYHQGVNLLQLRESSNGHILYIQSVNKINVLDLKSMEFLAIIDYTTYQNIDYHFLFETHHCCSFYVFSLINGLRSQSLFQKSQLSEFDSKVMRLVYDVYFMKTKEVLAYRVSSLMEDSFIHNQERYLNIPELMIHQNHKEEDVVKFVLNSGILRWRYNLEQQQNWALLLALDHKKMKLLYEILQYYIENPDKLDIDVLDHDILLRLLQLKGMNVGQFLTALEQEDKVNITEYKILQGQDTCVISDSVISKTLGSIRLDEVSLKKNAISAIQSQIANKELCQQQDSDSTATTRYLKSYLLSSCFQRDSQNPQNLSNFQQVTIQRTRLMFFDSFPQMGSSHVIEILVILSQAEVPTLKKFQPFIMQYWKEAQNYHSIMTLQRWLITILVFCYSNWFFEDLIILIPIILLNFGHFMVEIKVSLGEGQVNYWSNPFNWFEVYTDIMIFFLCVSVHFEVQNTVVTIANTLTMVILNMDCILKLRIFKNLRYLIAMIQAVYKDFVSFFVILLVFLVLFTNIDVYLSRMNTQGSYQELSFLHTFQSNYRIALGDTDFDNITEQRKVFTFAYTIILMVVLMNLLISVIGDTYSTFQSAQEEYDLRVLIDLILDYRFFKKTQNDRKIEKFEAGISKSGGFKLTKEFRSCFNVPAISTSIILLFIQSRCKLPLMLVELANYSFKLIRHWVVLTQIVKYKQIEMQGANQNVKIQQLIEKVNKVQMGLKQFEKRYEKGQYEIELQMSKMQTTLEHKIDNLMQSQPLGIAKKDLNEMKFIRSMGRFLTENMSNFK